MSSNSPGTILLVDDTEAQRYAMRRILQSAGFTVREGCSGADALRMAAAEPDLVLLDVGLPDFSGVEVCRILKSNPVTGRIPVIQISAVFVGSSSRAVGLNSGADAYLVHPVQPDELVATVNAMLRVRRAEQERERLIGELEKSMAEVSHLKWLLQPKHEGWSATFQPYGDLATLKSEGELRRAVGADVLSEIAADYMDLLETSSAIYEKNGACAMSIFSSEWCRFMDAASRKLCATQDNRQAVLCSQGHCHRSCWEAAKAAMETGSPVDRECDGGLRLYAVPIRAGEEAVGAVSFGYGNPPSDPEKLREIAEKYHVRVEELKDAAGSYQSRPPFIIDVAKRRLQTTAKLIGEIVERQRVENERALLLERERAARAEAEAAQHRVSRILESITDAFFALDSRWRFTYVNAQAEKLLQRSRENLIGRSVWEEFPEAASSAFNRHYREVMRKKVSVAFEQFYPPLQAWFEVHAYPADDGISVYFQDVTQRKKTEEALRMTEKLAAAGRMAGTLAHEINNPMAAITNLFYLLRHEEHLEGAARAYLNLAEEELNRVQRIIKNTLGFYREARTPVPLKITEILDSVIELYSRPIQNKGLDVRRRYDFSGELTGLPGELRQVFSNLLVNAIEAVGEEGGIRLHVFASTDWRSGRRGVRVVVADEGPGIACDDRARLFEPFFTSKGEKGTGLGLWVSRGIIQKHDGHIRVRSSTRPGRSGTCFSVFLPSENAHPDSDKMTGTAA